MNLINFLLFKSFITLLIHTHYGADFLVWQLNVLKRNSHNIHVLGSQLGEWLKPVTIPESRWVNPKRIVIRPVTEMYGRGGSNPPL